MSKAVMTNTAYSGDNTGYNYLSENSDKNVALYDYNCYNQITGIDTNGIKSSYTYSPDGMRFSKTVGDDTIQDKGTVLLTYLAQDNRTVPLSLLSSNSPTMTKVAVTDDINGDIMMYGSAIGAYYTGASYDAAKVLIKSLEKNQFSDGELKEYGVPAIETLVGYDSLFRAYCEYMLNVDISLNSKTKQMLSELLK